MVYFFLNCTCWKGITINGLYGINDIRKPRSSDSIPWLVDPKCLTILSRELTCPTFEKENHRLKSAGWEGIYLFLGG